jgi:quercetin dioxygenase-like cupin family protein
MEVKGKQLLIVGPGEGRSIQLGKGIGVDFKVWGHRTGGRLAIVENPIEPRRLVPPHTHTMEDELSYVLEGRIGVRVGDEVAEAAQGSYVYLPCGVPHTVWNPDDKLARVLNIICPAGFENYFVEIAELFARGGKPGGSEHEEIGARYHVSHFMDWVPELKARYNLKLLGEP